MICISYKVESIAADEFSQQADRADHHCRLSHKIDTNIAPNHQKCSSENQKQVDTTKTTTSTTTNTTTINTTSNNSQQAKLTMGIDHGQQHQHHGGNSDHSKKSLAYHLRVDSDHSTDSNGHHLSANQGHERRPQLMSASEFMYVPLSRSHQMRAYSLDISSYRREARYSGDASFLDSNNTDHIARCGKHLNYYASLLKQYTELDSMDRKVSHDALVLADAYGRPEAGVHMGNSFWLGQYTQCLDTKITIDNDDADADHDETKIVNSQYCIISAHAPSWNKKDTLHSIRIGVCMPETCTNSMLEDHFREKVFSMAKIHLNPVPLYKELEMTQVFCLPHSTSENRQFSKMTIGFLTVISLFVCCCLLATFIDNNLPLKEGLTTTMPSPSPSPAPSPATLTNGHSQPSHTDQSRNWKIITIEAFSISRNLQKIMHVKETNGEHFLDSLAGIKSLSLFWIIGAHSILIGATTASNLILFDSLNKTLLSYFFLTAHLVVDTFFAVSGILASYLMFKTRAGLLTMPEYIVATVHRYWRLTPLYLLAFWYAKSIGHHISSGPFWDYMTSEKSPRLQCGQESWLVALLHVADFKGPKDHCVPFAWFISNGIKFWLVTPIFVAAIAKSRQRGYILTTLAIVANIVLVFVLALKSSGIDLDALLEFRPESASNMMNTMGEVYSRPYSRIGPYLVGLIAGHLLFSMETKQIQLQLSDKANAIIWTLVCATIMLLTFMLKFVPPVRKDFQIYLFSFSSALVRPLWATCSCWLIFAIAQGQAKWLRQFLSSRMWQIVVRLSYSGYLVQGEVLAIYMMAHNGSHLVRYTDMITHGVFLIVTTMVVSFFAALLIEYPLIAIEELVFPRHMATNNNNKKPHQLMAGGEEQNSSANHRQQHNHQVETNSWSDKTRLAGDSSSTKQKVL